MSVKNLLKDFQPLLPKVRDVIVEGEATARWYCGYWECHNTQKNEHKYYEIHVDPQGKIWTRWGRIGTRGQCSMVNEVKAIKKHNERAGKGYVRVEQ